MDNNGPRVPASTSSDKLSSPPTTPKSSKGHHTLMRSLAVVDDDDGLPIEPETQPQQVKPQCQDSTGLINFIKETINKNTKDRHLILRTESELVQFINSGSPTLPLPGPYSSYQRLIIHRVAAYFRLEHNIDSTGSGLVIGISTNPLPESERVRFRDLISGQTKEDGNSGGREGASATSNTRPNHHHRKYRSAGEYHHPTWTTGPARSTSGNQRILKGSSFEGSETRHQPRQYVAKAYSFGGYQTLSTQTSLSPASSGYKSTSFPSMELRTPSPQAFETSNSNSNTSGSGLPVPALPELQTQSQSQVSSQQSEQQPQSPLVLFAVSDIKTVPPGAVLIDPTTLAPMVPRYESTTPGPISSSPNSTMVMGTNSPGSAHPPGPGLIYHQPQYYAPIPQAQPIHQPGFLPQPSYYDPTVGDVNNWFAGLNLGMGMSHQGQYYAAPGQPAHPLSQHTHLISSAAPQQTQHPGLPTTFIAPAPTYNYGFYQQHRGPIGPGPFVRFCYPQPQQPYTTIQPTGLIFQPQTQTIGAAIESSPAPQQQRQQWSQPLPTSHHHHGHSNHSPQTSNSTASSSNNSNRRKFNGKN